MKEIHLSQGYVTLVDDEFYEMLNLVKWQSRVMRKKDGSIKAVYAARCTWCSVKKKYRSERMHWIIADWCGQGEVDHIDGDGLNNTMGNLRIASSKQNSMNQKKRCRKDGGVPTSRFKGVCWHNGAGKWMARVGGEYLGVFDKEEDAARRYDEEAQSMYGEYSKLNFGGLYS